MRSRIVALVALVTAGLVVFSYSSARADLPIDDFTQAVMSAGGTGVYTILTNSDGMDPTKSATDTGLTGVIGGSRMVTVSAVGTIEMGHDIRAKVDTSDVPGFFPGFCANSSFSGKGTFDLLYDGNGAGLDLDVSSFKGIRIIPNAVDVGVGPSPVSYKVTLTDEAANSASTTVTSGQTCALDMPTCDEHRFLFANYAGIDLRHIRSILISISSDDAFDAIIGPIALFGIPEGAPLLSSSMITALVGALGIVGLVGMRRLRNEA